MTADDLAIQISRRLRIPKKDAHVILRNCLSAVVSACLSSGRMELRGFGTFSAVRRRQKLGRNFSTGKSISIPERIVLKFKPGKDLLDRLNPPVSLVPGGDAGHLISDALESSSL